VFETPAAVFIFDAPFNMRWVNIRVLFVQARNSWMIRNNQTKFQFSDRTVCNYIFTITIIKTLVNNVAPGSLQLSEKKFIFE